MSVLSLNDLATFNVLGSSCKYSTINELIYVYEKNKIRNITKIQYT